MDFTFKKEERLCSPVLIEKLYREGESFLCYPLRFVCLKSDDAATVNVKVLLTASKKTFKRAVDRNLLKRRMREAYRLNKNQLSETVQGFQLILAINYIGKEIVEFKTIETKMLKGFEQLKTNILLKNNTITA